MEWSPVDRGSYGMLWRLKVPAPGHGPMGSTPVTVTVAVKWIPLEVDPPVEPVDLTTPFEQALTEYILQRILGRLSAPSFAHVYGAITADAPRDPSTTSTRGSADLVEAVRGPRGAARFVLVSEYAEDRSLRFVLANLPASTVSPTGRLQILLQLFWSLAVAVGTHGLQHRDIALGNIVMVPVPAAQRYRQRFSITRGQEGRVVAQWMTDLDSEQEQHHRPLLIDYGNATFLVPSLTDDTRFLPVNTDSADLGTHIPPEVYFNRLDLRDDRGDVWQMGLVAAALLLPVIHQTPYRSRILRGDGSHPPHYENLCDPAFLFSTLHPTLCERFVLLVERQTGLSTGRDTGLYQHLYRYMGIALVTAALGLGWRPPLTLTDYAKSGLMHVLYSPECEQFYQQEVHPSLASFYLHEQAGRLDVAARAFLRSCLAWHPSDRPSGLSVLHDPLFDPLRTSSAGPHAHAPVPVQDFHWTERPPLRPALVAAGAVGPSARTWMKTAIFPLDARVRREAQEARASTLAEVETRIAAMVTTGNN